MSHFEGMNVYRPGDEDTTEKMFECLAEHAPGVASSDGMPQIDRMETISCRNGCCFLVQSHDGVNDFVYEHGPFPTDAVTNAEEAEALFSMVRKTIYATYN
jgi:hypothetical protein